MVRRNSSPYNLNMLRWFACPRPWAIRYLFAAMWSKRWPGGSRSEQGIENRGIKYWPSRANFVLMYLGEPNKTHSSAPCVSAEFWCATARMIRDAKIACASLSGAAEHNARLMESIAGSFRGNRIAGKGGKVRKASIHRQTKETDIKIALTLMGTGATKFLPGFVSLITCWSCLRTMADLIWRLKASGDLDVDQHHTVEDVGIVLGQAFTKALGDKKGILRAGYFVMPMDETLGLAAVDFSGRTSAVIDTKVKTRLVGDLQSELVFDFFEGFARGANAGVHLKILYGRSNHHKIESLFKAFARALRAACWRDKRMAKLIPSTKGLL